MANAIQKYAANKACCIATNVKKTDNKIKYGSEDMICCINKDFIANTFLELLMCNSVASDATWYKVRITVTYTDSTPTSFPGTITIPDVMITSYDGQLVTTLDTSGSYVCTSILDFNTQLYNRVAAITPTDASIVLDTISLDSLTGEMVVDVYYTSIWGNLTDNIVFSLTSPAGTSLGVTSSSVTSTATVNTDSCLKSSQLCDIKNWLDDYCQSC